MTSWLSLEEHPKTERNKPKDIHLPEDSATSEIHDKSTDSSSDRTTATIMYARCSSCRTSTWLACSPCLLHVDFKGASLASPPLGLSFT